MTRHESKDSSRDRFFEAAIQVCVKKGWASTRMEDIAKAADRSKGSLYHHFESKDELFVEMLKDYLLKYVEQVGSSISEGGSVIETMLDMTRALDDEAANNPALMVVFMEGFLVGLRTPEVRDLFREHYLGAISFIEELIKIGIAKGEFLPDTQPATLARLIATAGDGMMMVILSLQLNDMDDAKTSSPSATISDLVRILLDSARTRDTHVEGR